MANFADELTRTIPPAFWQGSLHDVGSFTEVSSSSTTSEQNEPSPVVMPIFRDATPKQMREVQIKTAPLLKLNAGWDGHDGKEISHDSMRFMWHILEVIFLSHPQLRAPQIVPLSYGGVQAEWHTENADLEIEVERVQFYRWYFHDNHTGRDHEGEGYSDFTILQDLVLHL